LNPPAGLELAPVAGGGFVVHLYGLLEHMTANPMVTFNHAVARHPRLAAAS
jgi:predicted RNA polymerase sigma factor